MTIIQNEVNRIVESRALGRSPIYQRLLEYLANQSEKNVVASEVDIATDVFERDDFDSSNDSTVRVYLHNLRQKLDAFYTEENTVDGERLIIPKGEYRLAFASQPESAEPQVEPADKSRMLLGGLLGLALLAAFFGGRLTAPQEQQPVADLAVSPLSQAFVDDDLPITIVVGDYFVFAEQHESGANERLIRDFSINSNVTASFLAANRCKPAYLPFDATTLYRQTKWVSESVWASSISVMIL